MVERFWRKSRSKKKADKELDDYYDEDRRSSSSGSEEDRRARFLWAEKRCRGVDLNRNFDFHWSEVGASDNPCHPTYAGPKAFSEPESKAIADFIMDRKEAFKAYLTLHSYSQMVLVPWGYTKQKTKDYDELLFVGRKAIEALGRVHGTIYKIGAAPALLYPTSGSSDDWAKGKAGIKYTYTIELRDQGVFGFLLPGSQIVPTGRETFAAVRTIGKAVINLRDEYDFFRSSF